MADLISQTLSTITLILGIAMGEILATRAFGMLKKRWLYFVEIALFVVIIVLILNTVMLSQFDITVIMLINFFCGMLSILFVRGVISGVGFLADHIKEKVLKEYKQEDLCAGLKKALERRGFEENEIKRVAKEVGFKQNVIREVFLFGYKEKPKFKRKHKRS
jgi:hypothetical protein